MQEPDDGQLEDLRRSVRNQLKQIGLQSEVHKVLLQFQQAGQPLTAETALDVLKGKGVLDQLVRTIQPTTTSQPPVQSIIQSTSHGLEEPTELPKGRAYLHVRVVGGKAFTDYLARAPRPGEQLLLSMELFGQRCTLPAVAAGTDPTFAGDAYFELPSATSTSDAAGPAGRSTPLQLLSLRQGLHLVVVQATPLDGLQTDDASPSGMQAAAVASANRGGPASTSKHPSTALGSAQASQLAVQKVVLALGSAEWRSALVRRGRVAVSVQLGSGPGLHVGLPASSAPAGMLTLHLELHPGLAMPLDQGLLRSQQRAEAARDAEALAAFVAEAKAWWADYVKTNLAFKARPIKVLASAEDGCQYPASSFVKPLQLGRLLPSASHAARWVSLLARREDLRTLPGVAAAEAAECWCTLHTTLASGTATQEEMALLLCSLLLGFGLDAWVCVGRLSEGGVGHMWVMTRGPLATPRFWEPSTGVRYNLTDADAWPYQSIGSVFNHTRLYANTQADDSVFGSSYHLEDVSLWRELHLDVKSLPALPWSAVPLTPSSLSVPALEAYLEDTLRAKVGAHRLHVLGLTTPPAWDAQLAHLLMPALEAYEYEACSNEVAPGNEDFQTAIKRSVPLGWVFKGFPHHATHPAPGSIWHALADESQVQEIVSTNMPAMAFALRVRVSAYPEGVLSIWLMLAVKFCSVAQVAAAGSKP